MLGELAKLTPAELRVYRMLVKTPDRQKQIARTLGIRPATVNNHAERIYRKLGYSHRHQIDRRAALILDHKHRDTDFDRAEPPGRTRAASQDVGSNPGVSLPPLGDAGENFTTTTHEANR